MEQLQSLCKRAEEDQSGAVAASVVATVLEYGPPKFPSMWKFKQLDRFFTQMSTKEVPKTVQSLIQLVLDGEDLVDAEENDPDDDQTCV